MPVEDRAIERLVKHFYNVSPEHKDYEVYSHLFSEIINQEHNNKQIEAIEQIKTALEDFHLVMDYYTLNRDSIHSAMEYLETYMKNKNYMNPTEIHLQHIKIIMEESKRELIMMEEKLDIIENNWNKWLVHQV